MSISRLALAAALTLPCSPALAEDGDGEAESIIIVGQTAAPISVAPRGLSVSLGEAQFEGVNALNTEDLMKYAPNFFVRKRYAGDSNGIPGFRGTHSGQSARTLVMVDGFTVSNLLGNSFAFAPKWGVVGPGEVAQFDIVYGPYSSRYAGNSMGGIVSITTRDPERTEAFVRVQGTLQPYDQYATRADYAGGSIEAGIGLRQKDGPWSLRLSGRLFRNTGQPMSYYGLIPVAGTGGTAVTGAVVDPRQVAAVAAGTGLDRVPAGQATPAVPGSATNPIFAAQSPARITQQQGKAKLGYDDGRITGQLLFAWWHNEDVQDAPDCYLRDAAGNIVCEGTVRIGNQSYTASGANWSRTLRDEYLLGLKLGAGLGSGWEATLALSTYQIAKQQGFTSDGYTAGRTGGTGKLADSGPTGWYTGDLSLTHKGDVHEIALGVTGNLYRVDTLNLTLADWRSAANGAFSTRTYGKTRTLAAWAEDVVHLTPDLQLSAGLRFEDWRAFDGGLGRLGTGGQVVTNRYASRGDQALNPSLSLQTRLGETRVQLSLAMAARFPTVGELFQGSLNGDGSFNANSFAPNLRPERSKDANLLVSRDLGPLKLTGSLFYQQVRDTIFQFYGFNQNGVASSTYKNIDRTRQWGVELIGETKDWPMEGMAIEANAAFIDSRTLRNASNPLAEGVQFPRIPKWRLNGTLRYDMTARLQSSVGLRYASRPNTDLFGLQRGDTFGFTSELFALDARINWRVREGLRLSAGVDNITNDRAWVYHPYNQRSFLVEAGWTL